MGNGFQNLRNAPLRKRAPHITAGGHATFLPELALDDKPCAKEPLRSIKMSPESRAQATESRAPHSSSASCPIYQGRGVRTVKPLTAEKFGSVRISPGVLKKRRNIVLRAMTFRFENEEAVDVDHVDYHWELVL